MATRKVINMKKLYIYSLLVTFALAFLITGCSEMKSDLTVNSKPSAHPDGYTEKASSEFHGNVIVKANWSMDQCTKCHDAEYTGGLIGPAGSCFRCHNSAAGPEACNTCHGDFKNASIIAPIGTETDHPKRSGAHSPHLYAGILAKKVACTECHLVPAKFNSPGHIDNPDGSAEIAFGGTLAKTSTNKVGTPSYTASQPTYTPVPVYTTADGCANVYCHGYFKNGNQTNKVKWTESTDGKKCGRCHGDPVTGNPLPKGNHFQGAAFYNCTVCHNSVKYTAATGTWKVDSTKLHIDGKLRNLGKDVDY
jgi:predicted CxxxxCH...CXXCH cytochrome family protein